MHFVCTSKGWISMLSLSSRLSCLITHEHHLHHPPLLNSFFLSFIGKEKSTFCFIFLNHKDKEKQKWKTKILLASFNLYLFLYKMPRILWWLELRNALCMAGAKLKHVYQNYYHQKKSKFVCFQPQNQKHLIKLCVSSPDLSQDFDCCTSQYLTHKCLIRTYKYIDCVKQQSLKMNTNNLLLLLQLVILIVIHRCTFHII